MAGMKNNGNAIWSTPPVPFGTQDGITTMTSAVSPAAQGPASKARTHGCRRLFPAALDFAAAKSRPFKFQKLNVVDTR